MGLRLGLQVRVSVSYNALCEWAAELHLSPELCRRLSLRHLIWSASTQKVNFVVLIEVRQFMTISFV